MEAGGSGFEHLPFGCGSTLTLCTWKLGALVLSIFLLVLLKGKWSKPEAPEGQDPCKFVGKVLKLEGAVILMRQLGLAEMGSIKSQKCMGARACACLRVPSSVPFAFRPMLGFPVVNFWGAFQSEGVGPKLRQSWSKLAPKLRHNNSMAVGQNQWYHFGVCASPILVYSGDWDVHWGTGF